MRSRCHQRISTTSITAVTTKPTSRPNVVRSGASITRAISGRGPGPWYGRHAAGTDWASMIHAAIALVHANRAVASAMVLSVVLLVMMAGAACQKAPRP